MTRRIDTSGITTHAEGTVTFDGPDAVDAYRVLALQSSMALYVRTGMIPTRGVTATVMRRIAASYSGSTARDMPTALRDLVLWSEVALGRPCTSPTVLSACGIER